jgi:hypothetical protein
MNRFVTCSAETSVVAREPLVFGTLAIRLAANLSIPLASSMRHGAVDCGLKIGEAAELNVELPAVRSGQVFDTLKTGLEFVASARARCIFPGQIGATSPRFSNSHTGFVAFNDKTPVTISRSPRFTQYFIS